MEYSIRNATNEDQDAILALLPRLAEFNIPKNRNPEDLWQGDADMLREWSAGQRANMDVCVAVTANDIIGVVMVSAKKEMMSGEPSAHLEVLALAKSAEGFGIATALLDEADKLAKARGAKSITLHVFSNNTKARALYERKGYEGELLRYTKPL